jgi:hypothetical protein
MLIFARFLKIIFLVEKKEPLTGLLLPLPSSLIGFFCLSGTFVPPAISDQD